MCPSTILQSDKIVLERIASANKTNEFCIAFSVDIYFRWLENTEQILTLLKVSKPPRFLSILQTF
jgi:hypothetical protein